MPGSKPKGKEMSLRILDCRQKYTGVNGRGDSYTIYEIEAAKPDGQKINEKLRSFAPLAIGQVIELTVTPFVSQKHGKSFTLQPKTDRRQSTTEAVNELRAEVDSLRQGMQSLMERVKTLETNASGFQDAHARFNEREQSAVPADTSGMDEKFGSEAPW